VFFDAIAGQVTWTVYCAVLPAGWFVQAGSFSLRNGGRLDITYRGPAGALLTLIEGNVCEGQASGCPASGQALGPASFGDQPGTLLQLASGSGYAIDVSYALYADDGTQLGSNQTVTLPPLGMKQIGRVIQTISGARNTAAATLVLWTPTIGGTFTAFTSLLNNVTNDPATLLPQ
jgi:hypothetical protein